MAKSSAILEYRTSKRRILAKVTRYGVDPVLSMKSGCLVICQLETVGHRMPGTAAGGNNILLKNSSREHQNHAKGHTVMFLSATNC